VVAASDGLAVEPAVMERDAAMRTDVAQREDLGPAGLAKLQICVFVQPSDQPVVGGFIFN
jgi:hypothetical protein